MRRAIQTVRLAGVKWQTIRYAWCPTHKDKRGEEVRTSDYLGATEKGWEFRCKETKEHPSHPFFAPPARGAPKTPEEAKLWFDAEVQKMAMNPSKSLK